jgi:hypothetical protein
MRSVFVKDWGALKPADKDAEAIIAKVKHGDFVMVEVVRQRNIRHHRKFFALMHLVFENQTRYEVFEDFLDAVKVATGHRSVMFLSDSKVMIKPKSIAFHKMDQDQFNAFYDKVLDLVVTRIMPGVDKEELAREIEAFLY